MNPFADEIFDREAVDTLADVDREAASVNVFRPGEGVTTIVDQTLARRWSHEDVRAVRLRLGITDGAVLRRAEDGGLRITQDRCMEIEHGRLVE